MTEHKITISQGDGIIVLGKRGSGKTEMVRFLVRSLPNHRFVVLDVVGNLKYLRELKNVTYHLINPHSGQQIDRIVKETMKKGNCMLVLDEADRIDYTQDLSDLLNIGRNYGIGYIATARRTANIHKDYLANQKHAFVFKHTYPRDLMVLTEWLEVDERTFRHLEEYTSLYCYEDEPVMKFRAKI